MNIANANVNEVAIKDVSGIYNAAIGKYTCNGTVSDYTIEVGNEKMDGALWISIEGTENKVYVNFLFDKNKAPADYEKYNFSLDKFSRQHPDDKYNAYRQKIAEALAINLNDGSKDFSPSDINLGISYANMLTDKEIETGSQNGTKKTVSVYFDLEGIAKVVYK